MKKQSAFLRVCIAFLVSLPLLALAQSAPQLQRERIIASYIMALARMPSETEISYWKEKKESQSINSLISMHRKALVEHPQEHEEIIVRSYIDAMGRYPSKTEIRAWSDRSYTYSELMKNHLTWLSGRPQEYDRTIRASYQFVLNREPSVDELLYWKRQGVISYLVMISCHEDSKRNQATARGVFKAGNFSTNSSYITNFAVSKEIASEARISAGLITVNAGNVLIPGAGGVVAAGVSSLVAAGNGHILVRGL